MHGSKTWKDEHKKRGRRAEEERKQKFRDV
jgi:hypothetical protein